MIFRFSLQKILELREEDVNASERRLEGLRSTQSKLKQILNMQRDEYFKERDELNDCLRLGAFEKVKMFESSLETRKTRMIEVLQRIREVENDIDYEEQILLQAKRNLKVLENLKEKKQAEFQTKMDKAERKLLDEHANIRHVRNEALQLKKARDDA